MKPEKKLEKAEIEKIVGKKIKEFSTKAGSNEGDNVAGNILAIKVTTADDETLNLVYKSFPMDGNPEQLKMLVQFGMFRTETCMYEKIFPRIETLLQKKKNGTKKLLPVPKYFSGMNDDVNDYVCMEDLRPQGFVMQDKFHSLSLAETTLVLKEMGRFHALTYFLIRYDGEKMFEEDERLHRIKYNGFTVENPMMAEIFPRMMVTYLENTAELLEPRDKELAQKVEGFLGRSDLKELKRLQTFNRDRTDREMFPCIVLGDCWTNNILFKYANEKRDRDSPVELKFIDFQLSRRGNIFEDLGYFFWTSTTPELRRLHLSTLLAAYYDSFQDTLKNEADFPMPLGFTRGRLIDAFYEGILAAFIYMPFALSLQMGDLKYMKMEEKNENKEKNQDSAEKETGASFDMKKMVEDGKILMKLRMIHSPRAVDRLEILTREVVQMKLL